MAVVGEDARGFVSPDNRGSPYTTEADAVQDLSRSRNNNKVPGQS